MKTKTPIKCHGLFILVENRDYLRGCLHAVEPLKRLAASHAQFRKAHPLTESQQISIRIAESDLPYALVCHRPKSDSAALLHGTRRQRIQIVLRPKAKPKADALYRTAGQGLSLCNQEQG